MGSLGVGDLLSEYKDADLLTRTAIRHDRRLGFRTFGVHAARAWYPSCRFAVPMGTCACTKDRTRITR